MSKPKRGTHIKSIPNWRGFCRSCGRTGVKLLWVKLDENNVQQSVCKRCGQ